MSRRDRFFVGFFFVILGAFPTVLPAFGASVLPLDLNQLAAQAGRIFVGRCVSVETGLDENGIPATYARFQVTEALKGVPDGGTALLKQFGTQPSEIKVREGERALVAPKTASLAGGPYRSGADYLLFLYPESEWGFASPVGGGQGRFEISVGAGSSRPGPGTAPLQVTAVNPLNNRFLRTFREGPVPLDDMVKEIKKRVDR